jgi:mRNA interferase MazF
MTTCKPGDVVDVPFPFIDTPDKKLRPALVVSDPRIQKTAGAIVLMMITSAERSNWETDIKLSDWQSAGLRKASIVRWKIFTIDEKLVVSRRGSLSEQDQQKIRDSLKNNLSHWLSR